MLELLEKIKSSEEFKKYLKEHPKAYLCSIFITDDKPQFSFYSKKTKLVTSFKIENNKVTLIGKDEKIFQKEKKDLPELHLDEIKINLNKAKELADNLQKEKYPHETTNKEIIILQHIQDKPVWNITRITSTFNIINIKLDAISGKIIEDIITPALLFKSGLAKP